MNTEVLLAIITATGTAVGSMFGYLKLRSKNIAKEEKEFRDELISNVKALQDNSVILFEKMDEIKKENSEIAEVNRKIQKQIKIIEEKIATIEQNSNNV